MEMECFIKDLFKFTYDPKELDDVLDWLLTLNNSKMRIYFEKIGEGYYVELETRRYDGSLCFVKKIFVSYDALDDFMEDLDRKLSIRGFNLGSERIIRFLKKEESIEVILRKIPYG